MKENLIQNAPLFSSLLPDEQELIGKAMKEQNFGKGESLSTQGQPAQRMLLIQSGWVKQTTHLDGGRNLVNNLGPGSLVGEMDVLLDEPAASSAISNSDVAAWVLTQADLYQILDENPRIGLKLSASLGSRIKRVDHYLVQKRLRATNVFSDLGEEQLAAIAEKLQPMEIRRGGLIFRAGAPGDALFIVEEGEVSLTSAAEDAGEPFRQLGAGEVMGEMAVLAGKPYDGLARAATEVVLWIMYRADFLAIATRYPEIRVAMSSRISQPLSFDDRALALKQLADMPLFANLPAATTQAVASVLVLRHYPAGERLYQAGDPGDSMIFVDGGEVRLSSAADGERILRSGSQHGETSLLTGKNRSETATAATDCNVWLLFRSDFDELLARFPALGSALSRAVGGYLLSNSNRFLDHQMRNIPMFAGLGTEEVGELTEALHSVRANRGEVLFAEGQRGDAIYFIESGEVQLATKVNDSHQLNFERLIAGEFFGELALLADNPRTSTARAVVSDTQLWALYKADFDRIVARYPQVMLSLTKVLGERLARNSSPATSTPKAVAPKRPAVRTPAPTPVQPAARPAAARPKASGTPMANGTRHVAVPPPAKPAPAPSVSPRQHVSPPPAKGMPSAPEKRPAVTPPPSAPVSSGGRPLAAKPSSVPPVRRPTGTPPSHITGQQAAPLSFKPPVAGGPQSRPVPKRPPPPLVPPKPRTNDGPNIVENVPGYDRRAPASMSHARVTSAPPRANGVHQARTLAAAPQSRAVAARPAPQRAPLPAVRRDPYVDPVTLVVYDSVKWVMNRSLGFKFRMAALSMMFVWLCGITAPVAALSALTMQNGGIDLGGIAVNVTGDNNNPRPVRAALLATFTPTAQASPTSAKVATVVASPTRVIVALAATNTPAPTARPRPTVTATPAGPVIASVPVPPPPSVEYKVVSVRPLTACENQGNHNVYVLVLDQQGNGIPGVAVEFDYGNGKLVDRTGKKVENIPMLGVNSKTTPGYLDWPSYKNTTRVKIVSGSSEQTEGLRVDLPDQRCDKNDNPIGNSLYHYSYLVVFQKTK